MLVNGMNEIFRQFNANIIMQITTSVDYHVHIHDDIEMIYVQHGCATGYCDGKRYELTNHDFFTVFPNQVHSYENSTKGKYYLLIIKPSSLYRYESMFYGLCPESATVSGQSEDGKRIADLIRMLFSENGNTDSVGDYLTLIFGKLLKLYTLKSNNAAGDRVGEVLDYCKQNRNSDISSASVAKALNISQSYLSYIFGKKLSVGFRAYINSLRINDAQKLLATENYSITEIAAMTGFNTLRSFNRAFLKKTGISPSQYRKTNKK